MTSSNPEPDDAWDSQLLRRLGSDRSADQQPETPAAAPAAETPGTQPGSGQPQQPAAQPAAAPARLPRTKLPGAPASAGRPAAPAQRPAAPTDQRGPSPAQPVEPAPPTAPPQPNPSTPSAPPAAGRRSPVTTGEPRDASNHKLARRPAVGRGRQLVRRVTGIFTSDDTPDRLAAAAARVQMAIPTGRRVVVYGAHGGAGASTAAAAAALHLAHHRADRTALFSAVRNRGALAARLGQREWANSLTAAANLSWTDQSLDNISLPPTPEPRLLAVAEGSTNIADVVALVDAAARTRAFTVIDGGVRPARDLLERAHLVLVTFAPSLEGIASARRCVQELQTAGADTDRLRLLVVDTGRDTGISPSRAASTAADLGLPTDILPADRHLAVGAAIDPALAAEATRVAIAEMTANLVEQAARVV